MANSYKISDSRTKVSRILEEKYNTTGTGGFHIRYQIGLNSTTHSPTTALFKEGSLTKIEVDKYKATEINGTVRYFYVTPEGVNVDSAYRRFTGLTSSLSSSKSSNSKQKFSKPKRKGGGSESLLVRGAKWLFSETDEDKANRAQEKIEDKQISAIVDPVIEKYEHSIYEKYSLDSDDAKTILAKIIALYAEYVENKTKLMQVSGDDIESKAEKRLWCRKKNIAGFRVQELIKHLNKKTILKQIMKDTKLYKSSTFGEQLAKLIRFIGYAFFIILLLWFCMENLL